MVKVMDVEANNSAEFEVVFRGTDDANDAVQDIREPTEDAQPISEFDTKVSRAGTYRWSKDMDGNSSVSAVHAPEEDSPLRETRSDPFNKPRWWREASSLSLIIGSMITFCVAITIALIIQILVGAPQVVPHAGVLSDDAECSKLGLDVLQASSKAKNEDATAVDAAILTALCLMVKNPHKGGLGGGGFMLIEDQRKEKNHLTEISFREMSPENVDTTISLPKNNMPRGQSIAIPGFLKGIKMAHNIFGKKPWKSLFDRASQMAADGITVNEELADAIKTVSGTSIPNDLKIFLTKDDNTTFLRKDDKLLQKDLSQTLKAVGDNADSFYTGNLAKSLVDALKKLGSNITLDDMRNYTAEVKTDVLSINYKKMSVVASGIPSSGPVLLSTLNFLSKIETTTEMPYHEMLEALKFSYGYQASWENSSQINESLSSTSPDNIKKDGVYNFTDYLKGVQPLDLNTGGQQHVTVIGHDHVVVTISSGIGSLFGSKTLLSGILMNDAMLDFSWNGKNPQYDSDLKPSQTNFISPRQRPVSAMLAALISPNMTKCGLYMGFDAHDWTEAISSLVQLIVEKAKGTTVQSSIDKGRLNQKMVPFVTQAENSVGKDVIENLQSMGHNITIVNGTIGVCSSISYHEEKITFNGDKRDEEDSASIF